MGGTGCSPATPAAEGVPHGGMGGARTDGGHPVTGPILKKANYQGKNDADLVKLILDFNAELCHHNKSEE
jgi:hypothetical protein